MRGTWHCLTTGCSMHGEGEWKAINIAAERHGKAESHSTTVAYIYPPELGKYPPERYQPSAQRTLTPAEQQLADKLTDAGPTQQDAEEWVAAVVDGRNYP